MLSWERQGKLSVKLKEPYSKSFTLEPFFLQTAWHLAQTPLPAVMVIEQCMQKSCKPFGEKKKGRPLTVRCHVSGILSNSCTCMLFSK